MNLPIPYTLMKNTHGESFNYHFYYQSKIFTITYRAQKLIRLLYKTIKI